MFQFLFKYPISIFSKGEFVLLGPWPKWILFLLILGTAAGLGWWIRVRLPGAVPGVRRWRAGVLWLLQSFLAGLLLVLGVLGWWAVLRDRFAWSSKKLR